MRRRPLLLLPLAALMGCEALPPAESARLPPNGVEGAGDPTRAAVARSSFFFARQPPTDDLRAVARAIADMEFLAASLPTDPRYSGDPLLPVRLRQARQEWRLALGVPMEVPAQAMVDRLWRIHQGAPDPEMAARLLALPALPRTREAATAAARAQDQPSGPRLFGRPW
ncbi:hypothetical protein ACI6QG_06855 [Roseococcus sp. DSY-14]|uniref:hypothetical protein n=1 Tax=Roseococcus sp. DSY-14 TaxID=3369650 RepID=UPI00387ACE03